MRRPLPPRRSRVSSHRQRTLSSLRLPNEPKGMQFAIVGAELEIDGARAPR